MSGSVDTSKIGAVVIGRNEGPRLEACLTSLTGDVAQIVYVDSGSTDNSLELAKAAGADVVELDLSKPFTAARARNTGLQALRDEIELVQLVDGDCSVIAPWIPVAAQALAEDPKLGVVCGRRREIAPTKSVFNQLCDMEWNTPPGEALACGGDALVRRAALREVGGFDETLIAGEEPELCVRLRHAGWKIFRLDHDMTWHDANILKFGQWWRRTMRAGHAFAEGAFLHGAAPEYHWLLETRRALLWGAVLPAIILCLTAFSGWALLLGLVYPLQVIRLTLRRKPGQLSSWQWAFFTTLGKFAEAQGALGFYMRRLSGRRRRIIEYN